jgi:peptidoglycan hydrolase CwlO-like protein
MTDSASSKWMLATMVLGVIALSVGNFAFVQHRTLTSQLSAATDEVSLSHDEVANLKAKVRRLQGQVGSAQSARGPG